MKDFIAKQKVINGKTYLLINYNHSHSNLSTLFRDDGKQLTLIADKINSTSSFTVDDTYVYYTDGISQGPWSAGIRPNIIYCYEYAAETPRVIEKNVHSVLKNVNTCILDMKNDQLRAIDTQGNIHILRDIFMLMSVK